MHFIILLVITSAFLCTTYSLPVVTPEDKLLFIRANEPQPYSELQPMLDFLLGKDNNSPLQAFPSPRQADPPPPIIPQPANPQTIPQPPKQWTCKKCQKPSPYCDGTCTKPPLPKACDTCRGAKMGCDGGQACSNCRSSSTECTYGQPVGKSRIIKACDTCEDWKMGCDEKWPCSNCRLSRTECTYEMRDASLRDASAKRHSRDAILRKAGQPKLPRTTKSCDICRDRKVKCDGHRPCDRCQDSGIKCQYNKKHWTDKFKAVGASTM